METYPSLLKVHVVTRTCVIWASGIRENITLSMNDVDSLVIMVTQVITSESLDLVIAVTSCWPSPAVGATDVRA